MTDKPETVEGLEVGQVITVGEDHWIDASDNLTPGAGYQTVTPAGGEVVLLGFENKTLFEGWLSVAVVRLREHSDNRPGNNRTAPGTVFMLSLQRLRRWAERDALAKKYAKEDKR